MKSIVWKYLHQGLSCVLFDLEKEIICLQSKNCPGTTRSKSIFNTIYRLFKYLPFLLEITKLSVLQLVMLHTVTLGVLPPLFFSINLFKLVFFLYLIWLCISQSLSDFGYWMFKCLFPTFLKNGPFTCLILIPPPPFRPIEYTFPVMIFNLKYNDYKWNKLIVPACYNYTCTIKLMLRIVTSL